MKPAFDDLTLLAALGLGVLGCTDVSKLNGAAPYPYDCENPVPIMQLGTDVPSGFYQCADGFIHRGEAVACVDPQGAGDSPICETSPTCQTGADCVERPYGNCNDYYGESGQCDCFYGCATDADCDPGDICACPGVARDYATCISADCITSDNCTDGLCGLNKIYTGCDGGRLLACTGPEDACHVASDCEPLPCSEGQNPVAPECTARGYEPYTCRPGDCGDACG